MSGAELIIATELLGLRLGEIAAAHLKLRLTAETLRMRRQTREVEVARNPEGVRAAYWAETKAEELTPIMLRDLLGAPTT